jgi:hypothetical protein
VKSTLLPYFLAGNCVVSSLFLLKKMREGLKTIDLIPRKKKEGNLLSEIYGL